MADENTPGQGQGQQPRQTARKKARRRSDVYEHFTCFTDAQGNDKARCRYCGLELGANTKNGTSNLRTHVRVCKARDGESSHPTSSSLLLPGPSESSDCEPAGPEEDEASRDLARMIALHGYDPSVVEDDYFRSFVRRLNPGFEVPSRVAIEEMCNGIFGEARTDSISRIRRGPGRVSVALGKAKTIEAGEVMYTACYFIDDQWNLHKVVYDAEYDATDVISRHEDRLSMVAYEITDDDIRTGLKQYIEKINSDRNISCTTSTYVDDVLHSMARCLVPDSNFVNDVLWDMTDLDLTRQKRLQLLSELGLDYEWAYDEPWCECYYSLEVLGKKRGFTKLVDADLFVKLLCKVWGQVYRGIQRISASTGPTSNLCLPELLKLRELLHSELLRFSGDDADVQDGGYDYFDDGDAEDALRHASDILDEAIQDSYLVWSVPLALDPRYKLRYIEFSFKRAFGSEAGKYISEVMTKISKLYADYIKESGTINAADQAWYDHRGSQDIMAVQVNSSCLDRYLEDPLAPEIKETDFDVLTLWKDNSQKYPIVAWMARDALAMPTCRKLSSDQIAQVRSILRGYSKKP